MIAAPRSRDLTVAPCAASLADARHHVRASVTGQIAAVLVEDCVLLTSELVAEAVLRGADRVSVGVQVQDDGVRVDVTGCALLARADGTRSDRPPPETCRALLEGISSQWGWTPPDPSLRTRTVWFELPRATCRM